MKPKQVESRWLDVQRRSKSVTRAGGRVEKVELPSWYGRMKVDGRWKWFKLFTDRRASQQRWNEVIRDQELRAAGVLTPQMDAARMPLSGHVGEYLESLKRIVSNSHYRIAKYMLENFIEMAGWKSLSEINEQSASRVLSELQAKDHTVAYTNQYLTRVKAFINWCIPSRLLINPLSKLKRGNAKKALERRARRPLAEQELALLLTTCPESRRLKYAFPAYTGLRRKELEQVMWGDLHLESIIAYITLRPEQTKMGEAATLPLHPYLVAGLKALTPGMPGVLLFTSLPEGRTMLRDLTNCGVTQADAAGRRADYHALRHTFAKRLDETGCSHATRRALMRHGAADQTDGYTLARLSEMYDAVKRLPNPKVDEAALKTATDLVVTEWTQEGQAPAGSSAQIAVADEVQIIPFSQQNGANRSDWQPSAPIVLPVTDTSYTVSEIRPRSSVG